MIPLDPSDKQLIEQAESLLHGDQLHVDRVQYVTELRKLYNQIDVRLQEIDNNVQTLRRTYDRMRRRRERSRWATLFRQDQSVVQKRVQSED